jgi:hypothetical protein
MITKVSVSGTIFTLVYLKIQNIIQIFRLIHLQSLQIILLAGKPDFLYTGYFKKQPFNQVQL